MKIQMLKVYVNCTGVKKRCRKPERHMLPLGNFNLGVDEQLLISLGKSKVIAEMRSFTGAYLTIIPVEIEEYEEGTVESMRLLDPNTRRISLMVESQMITAGKEGA